MKAILVIDMPDRCNTCTFRTSDSKNNWCYARLPRLKLGYIDGVIPKHSRCPLKPMPEERYIRMTCNSDGERWAEFSSYDMGYNKCIDDLLGEEE